MSTEADSRFEAAVEGATEALARFVVPLYVDVKDEPAALGTGFFVKAGAHTFLVSAAHVLESASNQRVYFYQAPALQRALTGKLHLSRFNGDRKDDPVDIGVLKLGSESAPPYAEVDKFAMDMSYLQPCQPPRVGKRYACVGFPATRSRVNPVHKQVVVQPYAFIGRSAGGSDYSVVGANESDHLVLEFDPKRSFDLSGAHRAFPKPHGMSGSPVFTLFDEEGQNDGRVFPVVAIVTSHAPQHRRLLATSIHRVKRLLEDLA